MRSPLLVAGLLALALLAAAPAVDASRGSAAVHADAGAALSDGAVAGVHAAPNPTICVSVSVNGQGTGVCV